MVYTITINIDNDAFKGDCRPEVIRILQKLAAHLEGGELEKTLKDYNGNTVGKAEVTND